MTELDTTDARIESYIYKHIGKKSAREMATDLGVNPEEIIRIKNEILNSVDVLTLEVQKAKLLRSLQELADDAQERSKSVQDERNYSGMVNAAAGAIDKLLKELNRMSKQDSDAVETLNQMRVKELLRLMDVVVFKSVKGISERYDTPEEELIQVFSENLVEAAKEIEG